MWYSQQCHLKKAAERGQPRPQEGRANCNHDGNRCTRPLRATASSKRTRYERGRSSLVKTKLSARATTKPQDATSDASYRCGKTGHPDHQCFYRDSVCHGCGKTGLILQACKSSLKKGRTVGQLTPTQTHSGAGSTIARSQKGQQCVNPLEDDSKEADIAALRTSETASSGQFPKDAIRITPTNNGQKLTVELLEQLDTGSAVSIIPISTSNEIFQDANLQPTSMQPQTYRRDRLRTPGKAKVDIKCN